MHAGSLVGYLFPFIFTWIGISNIADKGTVPDSVIYSFYIGAAILILCVIYTTVKVKEMPPKKFEEFHGITADEKKEKSNFLHLLKHAPKVFWTVGLVQFFCWAAFMIYVDLYERCNSRHGMEYHRCASRRLSGGRQLGRRIVCSTSNRLRDMGRYFTFVQSTQIAYSISLVLGGIGFISTLFFTDQYLLFISYLLIGCAWAAMLAMPFTILTNSISGKNMGAYLGLFNGTICIPQIVAAVVGGGLLHLVGGHQVNMLVLAGILLIAGAICVFFIKETIAHHEE